MHSTSIGIDKDTGKAPIMNKVKAPTCTRHSRIDIGFILGDGGVSVDLRISEECQYLCMCVFACVCMCDNERVTKEEI